MSHPDPAVSGFGFGIGVGPSAGWRNRLGLWLRLRLRLWLRLRLLRRRCLRRRFRRGLCRLVGFLPVPFPGLRSAFFAVFCHFLSQPFKSVRQPFYRKPPVTW